MDQERRRFFRIEDELSLACKQIDATPSDALLKDFCENEHAFSIRNDYNCQIEQHISDFQKIEKKSPELGRYLASMQKQLDRMTKILIDDEFDQFLTTRTVSLSAQGISFETEIKPQPDSLMQLNLKLIPSGLRLVIMTRVVNVENSDETSGRYRISLDFEHMQEADREILIKHIHTKQMELLSIAQDF